MKSLVVALLALCAAGCAPEFASGSPEAVVSEIYDALVKSNGATRTDPKNIPMTGRLQSDVWMAGFVSDDEYCSLQCKHDAVCVSKSRCESGVDRAKPEKDIAGACADCSGFSGLKIAQSGDRFQPATPTIVSAVFNLSSGRSQSVYFYLSESEDGWRVDNIIGPDDFNIRQMASDRMQGGSWTSQSTAPEFGSGICCDNER